MGRNKSALLVSHENDLPFLKKNFPGHEFIAQQEFLLDLKDIKFETCLNFFCVSDGSSKELSEIVYLIKNWFRDESGQDIRQNEGISIGPSLGQIFLVAFAYFHKNFFAIQRVLEKYEKLYISENVTFSVKVAASFFSNRVSFFNPGHTETYFQKSSYKEGLMFQYPNEHKFSKWGRLIQKPFLFVTRRKKHLNLFDWTTKEISKRDDVLAQNSIYPWKGYYFRKKKRTFEEAEKIFPSILDENYINVAFVKSSLERKGIFWDQRLIEGCVKIFKYYYEKNRSFLIHSYSLYKELFSYYRPKLVSIPGEAHYAYVLALQIARKMGIKSILIVDGYPTVWAPHIIYKDETGKKTLFDYYAGFGPGGVDHFASMGILKRQIFQMAPPLISSLKNLKVNQENNKALIMFPYPKNGNPQTFWDRRREYVKEVYKVLDKGHFDQIGIKIKPGMPNEANEDKDALLNIFEKEIAEGLVILEEGPMYKCIARYRVLVSGLSTTLFEAKFLDIPFYIYEPSYGGVTDKEISMGCFYSRDEVARNIVELEENINKNRSVKVQKTYLLEGDDLLSFDFGKLY
ncbi:hypothetical protein OAK75_00350 [Bacteriovoracales bacterium]|nr:hypothetical protein [Bacteriovoracales bacterium]